MVTLSLSFSCCARKRYGLLDLEVWEPCLSRKPVKANISSIRVGVRTGVEKCEKGGREPACKAPWLHVAFATAYLIESGGAYMKVEAWSAAVLLFALPMLLLSWCSSTATCFLGSCQHRHRQQRQPTIYCYFMWHSLIILLQGHTPFPVFAPHWQHHGSNREWVGILEGNNISFLKREILSSTARSFQKRSMHIVKELVKELGWTSYINR